MHLPIKKKTMVDALMHAVLSSKVECRSIWLSTAPTPAASRLDIYVD